MSIQPSPARGTSESTLRVGWIGAGRMGVPMAQRLLAAGFPVKAWNRTPGKLAALEQSGAKVAETLRDLADTDVVFSMLEDDQALESVASKLDLLSASNGRSIIWVDCSTVSVDVAVRTAAAAEERGISFLAAVVSGNPSVAAEGGLLFAASGSREAYEAVLPLLLTIGRGSHFVGADAQAKTVKLSTNLVLGILTQAIAEALVLAERGGVTRADFMTFLNNSALGSMSLVTRRTRS